MVYKYQSFRKLILFFLTCFLALIMKPVNAQLLNPKFYKEFLASNELYLINSPFNSHKLTTGNGRTFTFEQLIKENWPSKKIINIDEEDYINLKNRSKKFHVRIYSYEITQGMDSRGTYDVFAIQKGRTGYYQSDKLCWFLVSLYELQRGVAPERLIYTVNAVRKMIENDDEKSIKDYGFYKSSDYKEILKSDTLYVKHGDLDGWVAIPEILQKVYPYPVKMVESEEWLKAISEARPNILFVDYVRGGGVSFYNAANVYRAKDGKLIIASYPWKGFNHTMGKPEFRKFAR